MTPPDDSLAPVPRELTAFKITTPKYPNSASYFTCGDRIAAREARARKGAKRARVMHLRCCGLTPDEPAGVSGWQDVSDAKRDCLVRDIYDEKEIKTSDPAPQTEVEDGVTQDVTLESELWTFDEVEWHETTQDTTTIKYVPAQVKLREGVAKAATEETGPQQVRAWKLFLSLDTQQALPRQSGPVLCGSRQETHSKSSDNPNKRTSPTRTTKPSNDPTAAMYKHHRRTIQLIKSAVEDGDGRRAGKLVKGISGRAPAADVKRNWFQTLSHAQNADPPTPRPSPSPKKTSRTSSASSCSPSNSLPPTVPRDLWGGRYEHWTWMTEYDGDLSGCVWEAFWRLATADVPTEIFGTYLAARIVPATKTNGEVRPFAIGQVIRRLVCKAVRSMTSPHQFAVGMKQGPELLHKIVSAHVAIHRDAAMASVDVTKRPRCG